MDILYKKLQEFGRVRTNAVMAKYTTLHIGGSVQFLLELADSTKLSTLLNFLSGEGVPYFLLGGGSNLLWQDEAWEGVVIKMPSSKPLVLSDGRIEAVAGMPLALLVTTAVQHGLSGLEWAAGVPGTVGGAVRGNAGAMDSDTAHSLEKVEVWRDGEVIELAAAECGFGYRDSIFKHTQDVVIRAWYNTSHGDKIELMKKIQGYIKQRNGHYPALPSAGSFFKNIPFSAWVKGLDSLPDSFKLKQQVPAGWISEQNGLKGYAVGGAMVSKEHGNFLVNTGGATQADILAVVEEVQRRAYTTFGVNLEAEVQIIKT